jgi:acyl-homoserine lactone acylase PvdQ
LYRALFGDELGADLRALMALDFISYGPLDEALRTGRSSFWNDVATPDVVEGPADVWARALRDADAALEETLPDAADRHLARLRSLTFPHAFDGQPLLGRLFSVGPVRLGGDTSTVNVAGVSLLRPREIDYIASMRVVYTPADWPLTRGTLPLGQSGHRFSRYRTDQLPAWLAADGHAWPWHGPATGTEIGVLTLLPGGAAGDADPE